MWRDGPEPDWDRRLDIAEGAGRHLVHLLNDVLELSRLEADAVSLRPEPIDPRALAGEVLAMLESEAAGKGLRLSLDAGGGVGAGYRLDPLRLRQILLNLATNAVKFTPTGAISIRIDVQRAGDGEHRLTFAVENSGPACRSRSGKSSSTPTPARPPADRPADRGQLPLSLPALPVLNILLVEDGPENRAVV